MSSSKKSDDRGGYLSNRVSPGRKPAKISLASESNEKRKRRVRFNDVLCRDMVSHGWKRKETNKVYLTFLSISHPAVQPRGPDLRPEHVALLPETDLPRPPGLPLPPLAGGGGGGLRPLPPGLHQPQSPLSPGLPHHPGRPHCPGCLHISTEERLQTAQTEDQSLTI